MLWVLVALTLLALSLASTTRAETEVAQAMGEAERCYFYARGALETAIYRLSFSKADAETQAALFPYGGGMSHVWLVNDEMACHVSIQDEAGKLNLNLAKEETIQNLLVQMGASEETQSELTSAIERRRKPSVSAEGGALKSPQPFMSVEELLQVSGITHELMYGTFQRDAEGRAVSKRGLIEFLTVHTTTARVSINSASPEVLAALPQMDLSSAATIIRDRQENAFKSADLAQRAGATLAGQAASTVTAEPSGCYSLVATAWVKGGKVRRSIRAVIGLTSSRLGHERLAWYDEVWPSSEILKWIELNDVRGKPVGTVLLSPSHTELMFGLSSTGSDSRSAELGHTVSERFLASDAT
jgi:type II secretory pathway component PulK